MTVMTRRNRLVGAGVAGAAALAVLVPTAQADAATTTTMMLHARLHHSAMHPLAMGSIHYKNTGTVRDMKLKLSVPGLANRWVTVWAAGKRVGNVHLSAKGTADRTWSTKTDMKLPTCKVGNRVRVVRTSNHHLVASGVLHKG